MEDSRPSPRPKSMPCNNNHNNNNNKGFMVHDNKVILHIDSCVGVSNYNSNSNLRCSSPLFMSESRRCAHKLIKVQSLNA